MTTDHARTVLDSTALAAGLLAAGWRGPIPILLESTESTNADLAKMADVAPEGACIVAEHQFAGRGRQSRDWVSPPAAGLWMSVLVRPADMPRDHWTWLPLLAGLAAADAVRTTTGVLVGVKWPNDIVVPDGVQTPRKLGGVLSEVITDHAVVLGIGINVSLTPDELPIPTGTSITLEGASVAREDLLVAVLVNLSQRLAQWRARDHALVTDYRAACVTIGRRVEATMPGDHVVRGIVTEVDEDGHLLIDDGSDVVTVTAGDVIHATI